MTNATADPPTETTPAPLSPWNGADESDANRFKLEDLTSVLSLLRVVRLYENRRTRGEALKLLTRMGLHDPDETTRPGSRLYYPSPAEQALADYCAATGDA